MNAVFIIGPGAGPGSYDGSGAAGPGSYDGSGAAGPGSYDGAGSQISVFVLTKSALHEQ